MKRYQVHITVGKSRFIATTLAETPIEAQEKAMKNIHVNKVVEAPSETFEQDPGSIWDRFDDLFDRMSNAFEGTKNG
jgi:hypothetical protein